MVLPLTQPTRQPLRLRKPIRQPIRLPLYPTIMSQPQHTIDLPGGKIVNGELILDESPEAWRQFSRREERQIEPGILDGSQPETLDFKEEMRKLGKGLLGLAEAHDSKDPVNTEVHSLYNAISNAELRSDEHRKDRWRKSDTSSAWGPVQIMPDTMEDARRVGSLSGGIPLSAEEDNYVDNFLKGVRSTSAKDKKLYISIAKKLMHYYNNKYKDPLKIANVWRWGERGAAATDTTWDGKPGLGQDISSPKGSPGSDLPYWEEFKTIMGL